MNTHSGSANTTKKSVSRSYSYLFARALRLRIFSNERWNYSKAPEKIHTIVTREHSRYICECRLSAVFFYFYNVIVAWFLFLFFFSFSFFTACKVFDDNFTFLFTVRHYLYAFLPVCQHCLSLFLCQYEFEFVSVVNASLWLISGIRPAVSARHHGCRDGNLSLFGRCMEGVNICNLHRCVRYENHNRDDDE